MGNSNSIHLDVPTWVVSGSVLKGSIGINIVNANGLQAEMLGVSLACSESGEYPYGNGTAKLNFSGYNEMIRLANFHNGVLPRGQYSFPFELNLPHLPGTFAHKKDKTKVSIKVLLSVSVYSKSYDKLLTGKQELTIVPAGMTSVWGADCTFKATSGCCCWERDQAGLVNMSADLDKAVYRPGDLVRIRVKYANTTPVQPETVDVQLVHTVMLLTNGQSPNSRGDEEVLASQSVNLPPLAGVVTELALRLPNDGYYLPYSFGQCCLQFYAVTLEVASWDLKIFVCLPLNVESTAQVAPYQPPQLPETWQPLVAQTFVGKFENSSTYGDALPTATTLHGLRLGSPF